MDGFIGTVEHSTEPILGWRCWKLGYTYSETDGEQIKYHEPRLVSIAINPEGIDQTPWQPQKRNEAIHWGHSSTHDTEKHIPHGNCTCGYWAFKTKELLAEQYGTNPYAFGQVSLWGRVVQGEKGYRGQFAYPFSIQVSDVVKDLWNELLGEERNIIAEIASTYAIEVETFEPISFS